MVPAIEPKKNKKLVKILYGYKSKCLESSMMENYSSSSESSFTDWFDKLGLIVSLLFWVTNFRGIKKDKLCCWSYS